MASPVDSSKSATVAAALTDVLQVELDQGVQVAFPIEHVEEVIVLDSAQVTPLPDVVPHCLGVANLRGQLFWISDLASVLQVRQPRSLASCDRLVVVSIRYRYNRTGWLVNVLRGVVRPSQLNPPPLKLRPAVRSLLQGLTTVINPEGVQELVAILNMEAVISQLRQVQMF